MLYNVSQTNIIYYFEEFVVSCLFKPRKMKSFQTTISYHVYPDKNRKRLAIESRLVPRYPMHIHKFKYFRFLF